MQTSATNLQAMAMELRGTGQHGGGPIKHMSPSGSSSTSSCKSGGFGSNGNNMMMQSHQMLVNEKRNRLKEIAAEELGLHHKNEEKSPEQLLNTPLAQAMKRVGMTPAMDSQLNNYVKKKVVVSTFAPNSQN
jgi:hypothetical protein